MAQYRPSTSPTLFVCNFYEEAGRMGLHRDDAESESGARESRLSLSFGDERRVAPSRRRGTPSGRRMTLRSGDALIFGGPSRIGITTAQARQGGDGACGTGHVPGG